MRSGWPTLGSRRSSFIPRGPSTSSPPWLTLSWAGPAASPRAAPHGSLSLKVCAAHRLGPQLTWLNSPKACVCVCVIFVFLPEFALRCFNCRGSLPHAKPMRSAKLSQGNSCMPYAHGDPEQIAMRLLTLGLLTPECALQRSRRSKNSGASCILAALGSSSRG